MPGPQERRLAAILFTDIVGYSALMAAEEERGLRVRARHRELVQPEVERHLGEPIEMRGDECLAIFPSALDAVRCALAIQDSVESDPDLDLHIGIHMGDVVRLGDEISGDGVNVARRLCALTEGGGLCVSGEVRQAVRNQPGIEATSFGVRELKGVGSPVEVYALGRPGRVRPDALERRPRDRRRIALSVATAVLVVGLLAAAFWSGFGRPFAPIERVRSLAVLPLENLTGDASQEFFVDGMTEALITGLARVKALRVTSRTSVMQYKESTLSLPEIAAELGVDALIEGSVVRDGNRVRITVQLIDGRSDEHLWADQFDRELGDVLRLQSEIARSVAKQVQLEISLRGSAETRSSMQVVPAAQDAYMKGLFFANKHTPPGALRARAHFEEAMRLDPDYPLGYAGLADTLSCSPMHTWVIAAEGDHAVPMAVMELAWDLAHRAIELDSDLPEAQTALGLVRIYRSWDWEGALDAMSQALEINPSYEFALRARAFTYSLLGRHEEALRDADLALKVDPLNAQVAHMAGQVFQYSGDEERAAQLYLEATALDAANPNGRHSLGVLRCRSGAVDEGISLLRDALSASHNDPLVLGDLGYCYATTGRLDEARSLLRGLEERAEQEWVSPIARARIHVGLGESEPALDLLERAYDEHAYRIVELGVDDRWDPIRREPRFRAVARKIGLDSSAG